MGGPIAWIDEPSPEGRWGSPDALAVPLSDRGLQLGDGLFETVLVEGGRPALLAEHLARLTDGAQLLAMPPPPAAARLKSLVTEAIARSGIRCGALRLHWSRGSALDPRARGLGDPDPCRPRCWLTLAALSPSFEPVRVIVSATEVRSATSLLSRCKSLGYGPSLVARRQAVAAGADDALLASSAGGLCSGTAANLLVQLGEQWLTPPLSSGCLPGVMRSRALALGLVEEAGEAVITADRLHACQAAMLLNSLSCRPIAQLAGENLPMASEAARAAERFWRSLLDA